MACWDEIYGHDCGGVLGRRRVILMAAQSAGEEIFAELGQAYLQNATNTSVISEFSPRIHST